MLKPNNKKINNNNIASNKLTSLDAKGRERVLLIDLSINPWVIRGPGQCVFRARGVTILEPFWTKIDPKNDAFSTSKKGSKMESKRVQNEAKNGIKINEHMMSKRGRKQH